MPSDITDLPIGDAAHEVLDLEHSAPLDGEFDITLGDTFTDPGLRAHFARQEQTGAIRLYRLNDVTLDASLMLLLRGRSRITETRYFVSDQEYADTLVKPLPAIPLDPKDHYIIGCNRASHDYFHWLTQSLPAIDLSLRHPSHRKLTLVLSSLQPWQVETLTLLGYQDIPRLTLGLSDTFLLPSAEFSDYLGEATPHMVVRAAMATFRRLSQPVPWMRGAAEEIYVARTDAPERVAENEAELIALLERARRADRGARRAVGGRADRGIPRRSPGDRRAWRRHEQHRVLPERQFRLRDAAARLSECRVQPAGAGGRCELLGRSVRGRRGRQSIPARLAHRPRDRRGTVGCDQAADRRHAQAGIGDGVPAADTGGASGRGAVFKSRAAARAGARGGGKRAAGARPARKVPAAAWHGGSRVATLDRRATADRASAAVRAPATGSILSNSARSPAHQDSDP